METTAFGRSALYACAVAALLAGCGGSQPPIASPGIVPQRAAIAKIRYASLYSFKGGADGAFPQAGLIADAATLYPKLAIP